jgi:hypothetical protein
VSQWSRSPSGAGVVADGATRPAGRDRERRWVEVRGRMEAVADLLSRQGSVATRTTPAGSRVNSVRFVEVIGGRRRQRAV